MDDVFAVLCDGVTHFIRGSSTVDILAKIREMHDEPTEIRMMRCKSVPEAAKVIRYRYWPMKETKEELWAPAMRYTSYTRMVDFIRDLEDEQLTEEQQKFKAEVIEIDRLIREMEGRK